MKYCKKVLSVVLSLLLVFGTATVGSAGLSAYALYDGERIVGTVDMTDEGAPVSAAAGETTVKVTNCESEITTAYKESRSFDFEAENLPEGAAVHVYCNGEDRGESTSLYISSPTENYTVEAKVIDRDGSVIAESGAIRVHVKNGFFDRLKAFCKETVDGILDVVTSFFVLILFKLFGKTSLFD